MNLIFFIDNELELLQLFENQEQHKVDRDGKKFNLYGGNITRIEDATEFYEEIRNKNRRVKFVTVDGGHTALYEKPKEVVEAIITNL